MRSLARALLILLSISTLSVCAAAQALQKGGTGVITGRIMVGDKPAPGIVVVAALGDYGPIRREMARATTDYEGNYRLMGLPAGRYNVTPLALTLAGSPDNMYGGMGRMIILSEGETVEKIDFALSRTGVITGRITDADGRPMIEERVQLNPSDGSNNRFAMSISNPYMWTTDDRGVYRLYGIPPGLYTLSVGFSPEEGMVRIGARGRGYYPRTYYPGETDAGKAGVIEVTAGGEARDIDIKLGRPAQSFAVSGRVIDAETGKPVANAIIGYGAYDARERRINAYGVGDSRSNARGEFKLEGIMQGRFAAFVWSENETYSDPALFEITDADVAGLELKIKRGVTLSGTAQIEGTTDKSVLARLSQFTIGVSVKTKNLGPPDNRQVNLNADGSFSIKGLPPGSANIYLFGYPGKDLKLARIERDGAPQTNGIELAPGTDVTNVRLIFQYGSGVIRGEVRADNDALPEGTRIFVHLYKPGDDINSRAVAYSPTDARGRFIIEGLMSGDYQMVVRAQLPPATGRARLVTARQNVSVSNGIETEANVVLDLTQKATEGREQ
jgi:hypothetical protein